MLLPIKKPYETVETKGNIEFYYNADFKLVSRRADDTKGYRSAELFGDVEAELDRARQLHRYPTKPLIDNVIHIQNTESIEKAILYVKYKLLGEANYLDVYGSTSERRMESTEKRIFELQKEIFSLNSKMDRLLQLLEK